MKNIRAVYYTDHGLADEYKVVFYQSAFEMVLMQFLYCVQSGEVFLSSVLPEEVVQEFNDLRDEYCGGLEKSSLLGAAIFLRKRVKVFLLDGFQEVIRRCAVGALDLDRQQYLELESEYGYCFKKVFIETWGTVPDSSYCTVEAPLAYLFRADRDCSKKTVQWLSDDVIVSVARLLSGNLYNSMLEFKIAVAGLAGTIGCNGTALFVIIQSLMVTELVHDSSLDVQQPFSTILAELLERILEKEVVAI